MPKKKPRSPSSTCLPCGRTISKPSETEPEPSHLFQELKEKLDAFVAEQKLNHSDAREKILKTIVYEARHFKSNDLVDKVRKQYPEVGRATVYRNLPIFIECEILQEGPTDSDGQIFYELSDKKHHDHIVCLDCRHIFEFHDDNIENRQESISKKMGFEPKTHRHVIYASCTFIKKNQKASSSPRSV